MSLARFRATTAIFVLGAVVALACPGRAGVEASAAPVIRGIAERGAHPWLRWARFPDHQADVQRLYEVVGFRPVWVVDGRATRQAEDVIASLLEADGRGLMAADYDAARLKNAAAALGGGETTKAEDVGLFDTALTIAAMRYASDSYIGRVDPHRMGFGLDVAPKQLDLPRVVAELAVDAAPAPRLAALDPPFPMFARLRTALAHMRELAARTDLPPFPDVPKLHPGATHAGVPVMRRWLTALGDLPAETLTPADPNVYDAPLVDAMKRFQERHGRDTDGVVGRATVRDLRVPLRDRVRQIELAMERLRWLPERFAGRFVIVNIPEFRLRGIDSGAPEVGLSMKVVVGSAARHTVTPIMHADMRYVVFRPFWDVPPAIAIEEILPQAAEDPEYLARERMELVDGRVRQQPGPTNALGLVKFVFPNAFGVYMHDTPSKELFGRSRRDFSHGCIRVADPVGLAEFVLNGKWDRERIQAAMTQGADDRGVSLPEPVPVYLLYTTIVVDEQERVFFFDDIYGHDAKLARALAKGYPYRA